MQIIDGKTILESGDPIEFTDGKETYFTTVVRKDGDTYTAYDSRAVLHGNIKWNGEKFTTVTSEHPLDSVPSETQDESLNHFIDWYNNLPDHKEPDIKTILLKYKQETDK